MNKKLMIDYARKLMDGKTVLDKDFDMGSLILSYDCKLLRFTRDDALVEYGEVDKN